MRRITRYLLWLFVFIVPWDVLVLPVVGGLSRLVGLAMFGAALVTTVATGRFRKPGMIFGFASLFAAYTALSLLWTVSYPDTLQQALTCVQVLGSIWVVKEFARTADEQQSLLVAFCLGEFVPLVGVLNTFRQGGVPVWWMAQRYTTLGLNADDLGLTLAIGIPIAWSLMVSYVGPTRRAVRMLALIYFAVAPVAVLLTATRGAVLAGIVALSIVPLTLWGRSLRYSFVVTALLVVIAGSAVVIVPQRTLARVLTMKDEILDAGSMTGRMDIWRAGLRVFPDRPLLGAGSGGYGVAVEEQLGKRQAPHNLALGLLVEEGVVGFVIYAGLLGACAVAITRMPPPARKLWAVLMLSWLVGVMSLNWEYRKVTWLLFGFVAAQGADQRLSRRRSPAQPALSDASFEPGAFQAVYAPSVDQRAAR